MIDWKKSAELNSMTEDELRARFVRYPQSNKKVVAICDGCGKVRSIKYQVYSDLCHKCSQGTPEARKANSLRCIARFSDPKEREALRERAIKQFSDPSAREVARLKNVERFSDPAERERMSEIKKQHYEDHPETKELLRLRAVERFSDPAERELARVRSIHRFSDPAARKQISDAKKQYYIDNPHAGKEHSERLKNSVAHKDGAKKFIGGNDIVGHHMIYDHVDLSRNIIYMTRSIHTMLHHLFRRHGIDIPHINTNTVKSL